MLKLGVLWLVGALMSSSCSAAELVIDIRDILDLAVYQEVERVTVPIAGPTRGSFKVMQWNWSSVMPQAYLKYTYHVEELAASQTHGGRFLLRLQKEVKVLGKTLQSFRKDFLMDEDEEQKFMSYHWLGKDLLMRQEDRLSIQNI